MCIRDSFWPVFVCLANVLVPLWLLDWWTQPSRDDTLLWVCLLYTSRCV